MAEADAEDAVDDGAAPGDYDPVEAGHLGIGVELPAGSVVDVRAEHGEEAITDARRTLSSPCPRARQH